MNFENRPGVVTRRDALKTIVAGVALAGIGQLNAQPAITSPDLWALPELGYAYTAIEPHIDARTMEIHHQKHHQAYITAAKTALAAHPDILKQTPLDVLAKLTTLPVPEAVRTTLRNQVGGHVNHTFFWKIIAPSGAREPGKALNDSIVAAFGSIDELKKQFNDAAAKRFGSGWAWLSLKDGRLIVHSTANQDHPILEGAHPILGLDVWEHAYYLRYQNLRADYTKAFWNVVNWTQADRNFNQAKQS